MQSTVKGWENIFKKFWKTRQLDPLLTVLKWHVGHKRTLFFFFLVYTTNHKLQELIASKRQCWPTTWIFRNRSRWRDRSSDLGWQCPPRMTMNYSKHVHYLSTTQRNSYQVTTRLVSSSTQSQPSLPNSWDYFEANLIIASDPYVFLYLPLKRWGLFASITIAS